MLAALRRAFGAVWRVVTSALVLMAVAWCAGVTLAAVGVALAAGTGYGLVTGGAGLMLTAALIRRGLSGG